MAREGQSHSWASSLYWTITTMSTVGYGDITFTSDLGRLFSMLVLLSGIVLFVVLLPFTVIQLIVEPWMDRREAVRAPRRVPASLEGHIILVGLDVRSEEHTSELQSRGQLVCRLLLEKKNITQNSQICTY